MTRPEMQERIGAGPYTVEFEEDPCDENAEFAHRIVDSTGGDVVAPMLSIFGEPLSDDLARLQAVCDALNALWEMSK